MRENLKKAYMSSAIAVLIVALVGLGIVLYNKNKEYEQTSENTYNLAFYQLTDYVGNVEAYLAKSLISTTPEHGAETLTNLWREANLAQTYLSMLPIESQELEKTEKFLNQVSDYSYSLSRKNIYKESLTEEDLGNLQELHEYSEELKGSLDQLMEDLNSGRFVWDDLNKEENVAFAQQVSNIENDTFTQMEENFHQYSGLIYDGAYSEHIVNVEPKALEGEEIDEEMAKNKIREFLSKGNEGKTIKEITNQGESENAAISVYNMFVETENGDNINIAISKKGGHIVSMNSNRDVNSEVISQEDANQKGKEYLKEKGFDNMKETYYLKEEGIVTINYAYVQEGITVYPDLIKVKVALDNGEVLGMETSGYLYNHTVRKLTGSGEEAQTGQEAPDDAKATSIQISKEDAKKNLNKNLEILSEGLAIIPTEWKTEILCYEFKGKVEDKEFLVYINAENGREEDILLITNTPNGVLTL